MALTKEEILSASDYESVEVEVPEWGGSVFIRPLSVGDREVIEKAIAAEATNNHIQVLTLSLSIVNEDGKAMFSNKEVQKLKERRGSVVSRIYHRCIELSKAPEEGNG